MYNRKTNKMLDLVQDHYSLTTIKITQNSEEIKSYVETPIRTIWILTVSSTLIILQKTIYVLF